MLCLSIPCVCFEDKVPIVDQVDSDPGIVARAPSQDPDEFLDASCANACLEHFLQLLQNTLELLILGLVVARMVPSAYFFRGTLISFSSPN